MIARRATAHTSRVFLAPLKGKKQKQAAEDVGLVPADGMHAFRIEGPDRGGLGAEITRAVAKAGINIRGASGAAIGRKVVFYLAFEKESELQDAMKTARKVLSKKRR